MTLEEMNDTQEKAAKELADKFSRYVNGWSNEIDDVVKILSGIIGHCSRVLLGSVSSGWKTVLRRIRMVTMI